MRSFIRSVLAIFLCFAAVPAFAAAPTIKSFTPASGAIGTSVTVAGTAFIGVKSASIGGVAAAFRVVSAAEIVLTAPATAGGKIVVVTTGGSATSTAVYGVTPGALAAPASTHAGANITVTASGMDAYTSMDVFFDSTDVALAVSNSRGIASLTIAVPANATPIKHWITFDERSSHKAVQAPVAVNSNWLQANYNYNAAGYNPYEGALDSTTVPSLDSLWTRPNGGYANQEPLVEANGTVFVSDTNGNISAYSATGALVWKAAAGGFVTNRNPVIYGSHVYFSNQTTVFAYSTVCGTAGATCQPVWTTSVASNNTGLTEYNGMLYIGGTDGYVHPINPNTGALGTPFYAFSAGQGGITTPIAFSVDGSYAYGTGTVLQYNFANNNSGETSGSNYYGPVSFTGNLGYYETSDGVLHELRGKGWSATLSGSNCTSTPAVAYGMVFAGDCSYVWGFNAANGATLWTFNGGYVSGISVANHIVYACAGSTIVALNASNGAYLWAGGLCSSAPVVVNGSVYSSDANIYAFTIPSLSPDAAHPAPTVATLRRNGSLPAVRTPEVLP
jgi:hypothetical protein